MARPVTKITVSVDGKVQSGRYSTVEAAAKSIESLDPTKHDIRIIIPRRQVA
jgi:hypothetical protein